MSARFTRRGSKADRARSAAAGAREKITKILAEPVGEISQLVNTVPRDAPITVAEIDLLLHWCGDVLFGVGDGG